MVLSRFLTLRKNPWLVPYVLQSLHRRAPRSDKPVHLLLCIADHFEPENGGVSRRTAQARVKNWIDKYPELFRDFRDSDGRPPQHTFFYPMEKYRPEYVEALAGLCRSGYGEVEVHLHHDGETEDELREMLRGYKVTLSDDHGLLSVHRRTRERMYGFIHGNWALDNSRPDRRWCGVCNELSILRETGCYCDFTLPSAPNQATQTRKINSIYYACGQPGVCKAHDWGVDVGRNPQPQNSLMLIQGPLVLNWRSRKFGVVPRLENGCIQGNQPATIDRLENWLRSRVQVSSRPDWFFVKLHTHGGPEMNQQVLLGEPMVRFHAALAQRARACPNFKYHYVVAREMYNLAKAAEEGWSGSADEARDHILVRQTPKSSAIVEAEVRQIGACQGPAG